MWKTTNKITQMRCQTMIKFCLIYILSRNIALSQIMKIFKNQLYLSSFHNFELLFSSKKKQPVLFY